MLDLDYHGKAEALALQKRIADWSGSGLLAALETALDHSVPAQKLVKIDRLDLVIEVEETGNWLERLEKELPVQLVQRIQEISQEKSQDTQELNGVTLQQNFTGAFIFFLQQGVWPWWAGIKTKEEFYSAMERLLQTGIPGSQKNAILQTLQQPSVKQRLLWQLPDNLFYRFLSGLIPQTLLRLGSLRMDVEHVVNYLAAPEGKTWIQLWKKFLLMNLESPELEKTDEYINRFLHFVAKEKKEMLLHAVMNTPVDLSFREKINGLIGNDQSSGEPVKGQEMTMKPEPGPGAGEEGIYISNAGLVIVAGFLPTLLNKLGIANEQHGLSDKNRAAMIVQYLASGSDEIAEFELGLAKVLCGIEPAEPVDTALRLTVMEKKEAHELLLSAIEYWSVLKDTSVEGIRGAFLLREGKLLFRENEWVLQVEQRPYDMLLQHLPWNMSMIRLPWMPYLLRTEWNY